MALFVSHNSWGEHGGDVLFSVAAGLVSLGESKYKQPSHHILYEFNGVENGAAVAHADQNT